MAVSEQTPYIEYVGNGVATNFALNFDCKSKGHLIVLVDEIEPPIETWSLYSGNVVFTTAPASSQKITIQRNTPFSRTTDYQSYNNSFRPPAVNDDFDRVWLKLQELGVADWLLRLYIDRLHGEQKTYIDQKDTQLQNNINNLSIHVDQQDVRLQQNIDNLKIYVDDNDDELRTDLLEEIRKQGVALDQLEEYYNHLIQRLANTATNNGWDTSLVTEGTTGFSQSQINAGLSSITDLLSIQSPLRGMRFFIKSHHNENAVAYPEFLGSGWYIYEPNQAAINNGGTIINGWVLIPENNTITPYHFGWSGKDLAADMEAFQKCFDAVKHGQTIRFWHTAHLEKQIGKHTDIYGAEGRSHGRLTLNGGQPCLIMRAKKNVTVILDSAELYTETACQGLIDLVNCTRCKVISGKLTGGNYIRETDQYKFPPIDGTTGASEKGTSNRGFNTTTLSPDIGGFGNNAVITQYETSGGYGGAFPQFDGTTAPTWGVWRGGQLGNHSEGIRDVGGYKNEINGIEIHGFNGSAIRLGLIRSLDGTVDYPRISNATTRAIAPDETIIRNCYLHDCYIGGVHQDRATNTLFEDNFVFHVGHPNTNASYDYVDPGYGFSTSRSMPNFGFKVNRNRFIDCYRKGVDCHQGSQFWIKDNIIRGVKFDGIGIAVDDDYADVAFQPYFEHVSVISGNDIEAKGNAIYYGNGQFGRKRMEDLKKRWETLHVVIRDNVLKAGCGFYFNYGHAPFKILNNTFIYASPFPNENHARYVSTAINIGSFLRGLTAGDLIKGNTFQNSKDGNFANFISTLSTPNEQRGTIIKDNLFNITPWYYVAGADSQYAHNDVVTRSGLVTTPITYNTSKIPEDYIIESNIVQNDFHHPITFGGGGNGAIAYARLGQAGDIVGVQLLSGGSGYNGAVTATVTNKGYSNGASLLATATNGVITSVTVVNAGTGYRNTYELTVPRFNVEFGFKNTNGNTCNSGFRSTKPSILSVVNTDYSSLATTPFAKDGSVFTCQIRGSATSSPATVALINEPMNGGVINFWIKIPSGLNSKASGGVVGSSGALDGANSSNTSINANFTPTGFKLDGVNYVDGASYSSSTELAFDTWYMLSKIGIGLTYRNLCIGTKFDASGNPNQTDSISFNIANFNIVGGATWTLLETLNVFNQQKTMFGK